GEEFAGVEVSRRRALLVWTAGGGRRYVFHAKVGQVFPEKFPAVQDFSSAHVEKVDGQHLVFVVIAEDIGIVAFSGGDALLFLQLLNSRNEVAIAGGALELLRFGGFGHALTQRLDEVSLAAFEKKLHVAHGFAVDLGCRKVLYTRTQATLDVVLQARTRMGAGQIHFARRDHEMAMNQVDDAIGEIGREVWAVVGAAILAQAAGHVHAREALGQGQLHVRVSLVVAQQDVEARLLLLDKVVL